MVADAAFYRAFHADLARADIWAAFWRRRSSSSSSAAAAAAVPPPPVPPIDAEKLFVAMMSRAQQPDAHMYAALQRLRASGQFKLAALSNNVIFPDGHVLACSGAAEEEEMRNMFDLFVGSAQVGMRKPDRAIYEYTLAEMRRRRWGGGGDDDDDEELQPADVLFLDDIGANLKTARSLGMATIRVVAGRTDDAVRALERATGLTLLRRDDREGGPGSSKL
jgi:microsomal epoxide hydrolase